MVTEDLITIQMPRSFAQNYLKGIDECLPNKDEFDAVDDAKMAVAAVYNEIKYNLEALEAADLPMTMNV